MAALQWELLSSLLLTFEMELVVNFRRVNDPLLKIPYDLVYKSYALSSLLSPHTISSTYVTVHDKTNHIALDTNPR